MHSFDQPPPSRAVDQAVGRALRKRREVLGLSLAEVAGKVGLQVPDYEAIEAGEHRPQPQQIIDLTQALDLRVVDLFGELTQVG